jgi:hypothetical protein
MSWLVLIPLAIFQIIGVAIAIVVTT